MHSDPIADMATRMRNAMLVKHNKVLVPYSKLKESILEVLKNKNFIESVDIIKEGKFENLEIAFKSDRKKIIINKISKPGHRIYRSYKDIKRVKSGLGIYVVSTSKGIMAGYEAYKNKIGGEILLEVY